MRTKLAIAVAAAQLLVLAFMAGEREWVLRTGDELYLRTAPVDPRDPMRGDYVRFDYEAARVPRRMCRDGVAAWFPGESDWRAARAVKDRRVYVQVELDEEKIARVVAATDRKPRAGPFLRARVQSIDARLLHVRYGVEALFMEQGKAKALENSRTARAGVPLNIEVAVSPSGLAVMKAYRWEPLGIELRFDRAETPRRLTGVHVELKNYSDRPVAVVALPEGGSFRLVADERWAENRYRWVGEDAPVPTPAPGSVRVLQPGQSYVERLDFTDSKWFVRDTPSNAAEGPRSWEHLGQAWNSSFRIVYTPPGKSESAGLPHAELIRHTPLPSRAFSPAGGVD